MRDGRESLAWRKLADGRPGVIRNGYLNERPFLTCCGPMEVRVPRLRARDGEAFNFQSALVPRYLRRSPALDEALPWLYLCGVSLGNLEKAVSALMGAEVSGLNSQLMSRLKRRWGSQHEEWTMRSLKGKKIVYVWADAVYFRVRGPDSPPVCMLVLIGADEEGKKEFLAIEQDTRESEQSWRRVLCRLAKRGLAAPRMAVADGAMGFWAALEKVFPETRQQRCTVHKTANVLNNLPKPLHAPAKKDLREIWASDTRAHAERAARKFGKTYGAKHPKAVENLEKDLGRLLTFHDFPAEHWQSIRATNVVESAFSTIRLRTRQTRGCNSPGAITGMVFKLAMVAEKNWKRLRGRRLLPLVLEFVPFKDGVRQEEEEGKDARAA